MDKMEIAYTHNLTEIYIELIQRLCKKKNVDLEHLVVQNKNQLMIADQSFKEDVLIIDILEWNYCTQKFKIALQNVFNHITQKHYETIKNNSEIFSLFKDVANTSTPDCYDKKSPYMISNYPKFFQNYQKAIRTHFKLKERKRIVEICDNYLKQIQIIALMETLIELKNKIEKLQKSLGYSQIDNQHTNSKKSSYISNEIIFLDLLNKFYELSDNNKQKFINAINEYKQKNTDN